MGLRVRDEGDREPVAPLGRTLKKKKKKVLSGLEKEPGLGLKGIGLKFGLALNKALRNHEKAR